MDFVYLPEVFTYQYTRNTHRDYEQPWNQDYFKCNNKKSTENQRIQQQDKESCHLCKEMKRRNLAVYIKSKSRSDSICRGIHEEEEIDVMHDEKNHASVNQEKNVTSSCKTSERKS